MSRLNAGGYLSSLAEKLFTNGKLDASHKLKTNDLERICTYYGHLSKMGDLYDILFEGENQKVTLDGDEINTKDLMWFAMIDHEFARGWYWKPLGKATTDTSVNHSVPLAFKGARRLYNKSYMSWFEDVKDLNKAKWIKCDMFLPQGLNSFRIAEGGKPDVEIDSPSRGGFKGLIHHHINDYMFTESIIRDLRDEVPNYAVSARPRKVLGNDLYNDSSYLMRCMILQGWCWYNPSRHSDQITDPKNWDNLGKSLDQGWGGITPKANAMPDRVLRFTNSPVLEYVEEPSRDDLSISS